MKVQPVLAITWNHSNIIFNKTTDKYEYTDIPTTNGFQLVFTDPDFNNTISKGDTVVEFREYVGIGEIVEIKSEHCIASDIQKKVIVEQNQISKDDILRFIALFNISKVNVIEIEMNVVSFEEEIKKYNKPKLTNGYVTIIKKDSWNREELVDIIQQYERVIYGTGGNPINKINRFLQLYNI